MVVMDTPEPWPIIGGVSLVGSSLVVGIRAMRGSVEVDGARLVSHNPFRNIEILADEVESVAKTTVWQMEDWVLAVVYMRHDKRHLAKLIPMPAYEVGFVRDWLDSNSTAK